MKRKMFRGLVYLCFSFLLLLVGCGIILKLMFPGINILYGINSMVSRKEDIGIGPELKSIYQPELSAEEGTRALEDGKSPYGTAGFRLGEGADANGAQEADEQEVETVSMNELQFPDLGMHYAMLFCARIQLEAPVYWGDTKEILHSGVGQYTGSFLPGFGRSILLSGHNTSFFKPLEKIEEGDIVTCRTNYGEYRYVVKEMLVMSAEDAQRQMDGILSSREEVLIMYTCYPFESIAKNRDKRLFVYADKVQGPLIK